MTQAVDRSRRNLLRGRGLEARPPLRPPWTSEATILADCSRCGACVSACPEAILRPGDGGFPAIDFARGACSFCGACAAGCPEPVFGDPMKARAFSHAPAIGADCLAQAGVLCQSCGDACPDAAIRFRLCLRSVPQPEVQSELCSGCGACVAACPVSAIALLSPGDGKPNA